MNILLRLLPVWLAALGPVLAQSQHSCDLTGIDPGPDARACTDPTLQALYPGRLCPVVPLTQKITFNSPPGATMVMQCYRPGVTPPLGNFKGINSGDITWAECTTGVRGNLAGLAIEIEPKLWVDGDASNCNTKEPVAKLVQPASSSCASPKLTIAASLTSWDTPVTISPADCVVGAIRVRENGVLVGQRLRAVSGIPLSQLATGTSQNLTIEIVPALLPGTCRPEADALSDSKSVQVDDCTNLKFNIAFFVNARTKVYFHPGTCKAPALQGYDASGKLVGEVTQAISGNEDVGRICGSSNGRCIIKLFAGKATPSEERWIEKVDPGQQPAFVDLLSTPIGFGWLGKSPGFSNEISNACCYSTGLDDFLKTKADTVDALGVFSNARAAASTSHADAGLRLYDAGVKGRVRYSVKIMSATPENSQVCGEFSVQSGLRQADGAVITSVAALQCQAVNKAWAIWTASGWAQVLPGNLLSKGKWYRLNLDLDFGTGKYISASVRGEDVNWVKDLSSWSIPGSNRGFDPGTVITVEGENLATCDKPAVVQSQIYYSDIELVPLATLVNSASGLEGTLAPLSFGSLYGAFGIAPTAAGSDVFPPDLGGGGLVFTGPSTPEKSAGLVYVGLAQVNASIPDLELGRNEYRVLRSGTLVGVGSVDVKAVAPGLFSCNGSGLGPAAAQILVCSSGTCHLELSSFRDKDVCAHIPLDLSLYDAGYLILYGTGFTRARDVRLFVRGNQLGTLYCCAQASPGGPLNQLNSVRLPMALSGAGAVEVYIVADGVESNHVTVAFK